VHGDAGNGYAAFRRLKAAGLLDGATAYVRTPSGGLHAYFAGSDQRNGHLPRCHLDFRSQGGYVLTPPSRVDGKPYQLIKQLGGHGGLDWDAVICHLQPQRESRRARHPQADSQDISGLPAARGRPAARPPVV
jgi:Bifunctional DNA primase/polymerase, N-terminal